MATSVKEPLPRGILLVTGFAAFVVGMNLTMMNVTYEGLRETYPNVSPESLSWIITGYATVNAALLLASGRLGDVVGRRRTFLAGMTIFAVGTTAAGFAPHPFFIIGARIVEAAGAALVGPASLALLVAAVPASRRSAAIGIWGSLGAVSAAVGPAVGSALIETVSWRAVFWIHLPVSIAILVAGPRILSEPDRFGTRRLPDPVGVVLSAVAVGAVALAVVQSDQWGRTDPRVLAAAALSAVALLGFALRNRSHPNPVLPVELARNKNFRAAFAISIVFGTAFAAMIFANVLFLRRVWGYSLFLSGLGITPSPLMAGFVAPFAGRLADRHGFRLVMVPGLLSFLAGLAWLAFVVGTEPDYLGKWLPGTLLFGGGVGCVFTNVAAAAVHGVRTDHLGIASAANNAGRVIGTVIGPAFVIASVGATTGAAAIADFDRTYLTLMVINAIAVLIAVTQLPGPPKSTAGDVTAE